MYIVSHAMALEAVYAEILIADRSLKISTNCDILLRKLTKTGYDHEYISER